MSAGIDHVGNPRIRSQKALQGKRRGAAAMPDKGVPALDRVFVLGGLRSASARLPAETALMDMARPRGCEQKIRPWYFITIVLRCPSVLTLGACDASHIATNCPCLPLRGTAASSEATTPAAAEPLRGVGIKPGSGGVR